MKLPRVCSCTVHRGAAAGPAAGAAGPIDPRAVNWRPNNRAPKSIVPEKLTCGFPLVVDLKLVKSIANPLRRYLHPLFPESSDSPCFPRSIPVQPRVYYILM